MEQMKNSIERILTKPLLKNYAMKILDREADIKSKSDKFNKVLLVYLVLCIFILLGSFYTRNVYLLYLSVLFSFGGFLGTCKYNFNLWRIILIAYHKDK